METDKLFCWRIADHVATRLSALPPWMAVRFTAAASCHRVNSTYIVASHDKDIIHVLAMSLFLRFILVTVVAEE